RFQPGGWIERFDVPEEGPAKVTLPGFGLLEFVLPPKILSPAGQAPYKVILARGDLASQVGYPLDSSFLRQVVLPVGSYRAAVLPPRSEEANFREPFLVTAEGTRLDLTPYLGSAHRINATYRGAPLAHHDIFLRGSVIESGKLDARGSMAFSAPTDAEVTVTVLGQAESRIRSGESAFLGFQTTRRFSQSVWNLEIAASLLRITFPPSSPIPDHMTIWSALAPGGRYRLDLEEGARIQSLLLPAGGYGLEDPDSGRTWMFTMNEGSPTFLLLQ
ncbi:MAG: hypothetical protein ACE5H3_03075, partial [Planctomycetota bacterium]